MSLLSATHVACERTHRRDRSHLVSPCPSSGDSSVAIEQVRQFRQEGFLTALIGPPTRVILALSWRHPTRLSTRVWPRIGNARQHQPLLIVAAVHDLQWRYKKRAVSGCGEKGDGMAKCGEAS